VMWGKSTEIAHGSNFLPQMRADEQAIVGFKRKVRPKKNGARPVVQPRPIAVELNYCWASIAPIATVPTPVADESTSTYSPSALLAW
jgi:hypothetical protein